MKAGACRSLDPPADWQSRHSQTTWATIARAMSAALASSPATPRGEAVKSATTGTGPTGDDGTGGSEP
jgi:hypothetical protein